MYVFLYAMYDVNRNKHNSETVTDTRVTLNQDKSPFTQAQEGVVLLLHVLHNKEFLHKHKHFHFHIAHVHYFGYEEGTSNCLCF